MALLKQQRQHAVNLVYDWYIVKEKPYSYHDSVGCSYSGKNNERCAFAVVLENDLGPGIIKDICDNGLNGESAEVIIDTFSLEQYFNRDRPDLFYNYLQSCHDFAAGTCEEHNREEFIRILLIELKKLTQKFNLRMPND